MADSLETRTVHATVEVRDEGDTPTIVGHAATFDQPYEVGYFTERINPDAFKRTLANSPDVRLLINHDGIPLGRTKSGTLSLGTDGRGLTVESPLDASNPKVQEVMSALKRGDIDQMSFAFRVPSGGDSWDYSGDAPMRTIREASLSGGDVSIVTYPANENASVALRERDSREAAYTLVLAYLTEMREGRAIDMSRFGEALAAMSDDNARLRITTEDAREIAEMLDRAQEPADVPSGFPSDLASRLAEADALRRKAS